MHKTHKRTSCPLAPPDGKILFKQYRGMGRLWPLFFIISWSMSQWEMYCHQIIIPSNIVCLVIFSILRRSIGSRGFLARQLWQQRFDPDLGCLLCKAVFFVGPAINSILLGCVSRGVCSGYFHWNGILKTHLNMLGRTCAAWFPCFVCKDH